MEYSSILPHGIYKTGISSGLFGRFAICLETTLNAPQTQASTKSKGIFLDFTIHHDIAKSRKLLPPTHNDSPKIGY
jgi:hypothetical protein